MLHRWLKFNAVGVAGAAVQLAALWLCTRALGIQYVVATIIAVEIAVLHNFVWHQMWTWRGMPVAGWQRRLMRFHLANGVVSLASNGLLTFLFRHYLGLPLLVSNFAAILITALVNFALANGWVFVERRCPARRPQEWGRGTQECSYCVPHNDGNENKGLAQGRILCFRGCVRHKCFRHAALPLIASFALLDPVPAPSGILTTKLQDNTIGSWDKYIDKFEHSGYLARPMLDAGTDSPTLINLNPNGTNDGADVPGGYIHHWIGVIRIPNCSVARVVAVLEDYDHYTEIYPEVKIASAARMPGEAGRTYDVRLVTEQSERLGIHFAWDTRFHVSYSTANYFTLIESRSYRIREISNGKARSTDFMPEGNDHGIVWRLNSYWRLRQVGTSVYAELQVINLSRKPLIGMRDLIESRAKNSLGATLWQTRNRALRGG